MCETRWDCLDGKKRSNTMLRTKLIQFQIERTAETTLHHTRQIHLNPSAQQCFNQLMSIYKIIPIIYSLWYVQLCLDTRHIWQLLLHCCINTLLWLRAIIQVILFFHAARSDANTYQVNGICARGFAEQTKPVNYILCSLFLKTSLRIKEKTLNKLAIRSKDKWTTPRGLNCFGLNVE